MKLTEAEAKERSKLKGPQDTLRAIANGHMVISIDHNRRAAYLEEYGGTAYRDPEFPERKMLVSGACTLFDAGYLTEFGTITSAGRAALEQSKEK